MGRFVDLETGATATIDMSPYVSDPSAAEVRLDTRDVLLLEPTGDALLVDGLGTLVHTVPFPVKHIPDGIPIAAAPGRPSSDLPPSTITVVGVASGGRTVSSIDVAHVDATTLDVVDGPTRIDLPGPAYYMALQNGSVIALEYRDSEAIRYEFRDTDGVVLAEGTLPFPVGWAALTGDGRHVVAARASDDSVRVVDTSDGRVTVLPVNSEPQEPHMLSDSRFMLQTREGQYELWDAAGPTRIGALADPGPYATTSPSVARDESHVWIVLDGAWTWIPLDPREWRDRACTLAGRSLTEQEWRDFVPGERPYNDACAATP